MDQGNTPNLSFLIAEGRETSGAPVSVVSHSEPIVIQQYNESPEEALHRQRQSTKDKKNKEQQLAASNKVKQKKMVAKIESPVTAELLKQCFEKMLCLERHYWTYLALDIAKELNRKPWLLNYGKSRPIGQLSVIEKELLNSLKEIETSHNQMPTDLKKSLAKVSIAVWKKEKANNPRDGYYCDIEHFL